MIRGVEIYVLADNVLANKLKYSLFCSIEMDYLSNYQFLILYALFIYYRHYEGNIAICDFVVIQSLVLFLQMIFSNLTKLIYSGASLCSPFYIELAYLHIVSLLTMAPNQKI